MNISTANSSSVSDINAQITFLTSAACAANLILSVPINGYVIWLIMSGEGGAITNDFFTLNLSVSEILFCLSSVFYMINYVTFLWQFGFGFLYSGRPLFQSCTCVELYLAVVHPVTFLKYKPLRYRLGFCGAVWLVVLGCCLLNVLVMGQPINNYAYLSLYLILIFVMLFCCISVLRALKQPGPGGGDRGGKGEGPNNRKRRAFRIILIILASMMVNYLPVMVNMSLANVLDPDAFTLSWYIVLSLDVMSGFLQPLLFLHRAGKLSCISGL